MKKNSRFRVCRFNRGLSQQEVARALNVSQSLVSRWELGKQNPGAIMRKRLLEFFGEDVFEEVDGSLR